MKIQNEGWFEEQRKLTKDYKQRGNEKKKKKKKERIFGRKIEIKTPA